MFMEKTGPKPNKSHNVVELTVSTFSVVSKSLYFPVSLCIQQASGLFAHLVSTVQSSLPVPPTPDLSADVLNALSALTLASAQECFVRKAINGQYQFLCCSFI